MPMSKQQPVYRANLAFRSFIGNLPQCIFEQIQEPMQQFAYVTSQSC